MPSLKIRYFHSHMFLIRSYRCFPKGDLDVQFKFLNLPPFDRVVSLRMFLRRLFLRVQIRSSEPLCGFLADGFNCFLGHMLQAFSFVTFLPELSVSQCIMDLFIQDTE